MGEALIRQRVEDLVKALRAKDIDGIMSFYAPNMVSFDIVPPLELREAPGCSVDQHAACTSVRECRTT